MTQTIEQLQVKNAELEKELLKTKLDLLTSYGESEELSGRIAELEADLEFQTNARIQDRKDAETNYKNWNAELKKQLAAEQLNNKRLREALDDTFSFLERHSNRWDGINGKHPQTVAEAAREALSLHASTEALDKHVAEKVKEAGKFDMWKTNPYTKVLETSIEQLTKQRDLAVEAIRHCIAAMGSVTDVKKAMDWPQLHNAQMLSLQALDTIKESEAK